MACMRWCVADVVINALAIYAVMRGREDEDWWWLRDKEGFRPDVSLPPGIWGVTDHGAGVQVAASTRGRTVGGVAEEASVGATEKSAMRRSIGFLEEYTLSRSSGEKPPPPPSNRRSRLDDLFSPLSPPPPTKSSPLDPPLNRQMARKAKCVSLQPDPRRPSNIKMRFSSSFDSLGRHAGKGKGKEKDEWSGAAVSSGSLATAQGHSALATPFPLVDPHPPPLLSTDPPTLPAS